MRRSATALEARNSLFRKAIELCRPSGAQLVFSRFTQGLRVCVRTNLFFG